MHRYFPSAQHEECISYQPECEARVYIKCILRAMCLCILRDYRNPLAIFRKNIRTTKSRFLHWKLKVFCFSIFCFFCRVKYIAQWWYKFVRLCNFVRLCKYFFILHKYLFLYYCKSRYAIYITIILFNQVLGVLYFQFYIYHIINVK